MKLHKKKVRILLSGLVILTILTSVLCSFAPPVVGWTQYNVTSLTEIDVENLMAVANFQEIYGSFNSYIPVACQIHTNYVRIYCVPRNSTWTFTESNGTYTLSSNLNGNTYIMRSNFTETGFGMQYTGGIATIPANQLIFYRSENGTLVKGEAFSYATGADNDVIADCAAAWFETWNVVDGYETAIDEAESVGFESGYDVGYADGLDQGFADGLEEGESRGYESGFDNGYSSGYRQGEFDGISSGYELGYADGESNGYESGYYRGYAEGYIDGYDTGKAEGGDGEVVTEIVYRDPVEINVGEVISGISSMPQNLIGSAFGFELFGINIAGLLTTLIVLAVGGFIVGIFLKKR